MQPPFDIAADLDTPVSVYLKLAALRPRVLLESVESGFQLARYSFLGFGGAQELRLSAHGFAVNGTPRPRPSNRPELLGELRKALQNTPELHPAVPGLPFTGGLVGVAIRQPVFTTMIMLGLMVVGFFSALNLPIEEYPDVSIPVLTIQTVYIGSSPEAIEQQVTRVIEEAVNTTQGIDKLNSTSIEGVSLITIFFKLGTDINVATADVRSKIEQVRRQLPMGIDPPIIQQIDVSQQPILSLALSSSSKTMGELTALADGDVRRRLESIDGVGRVQFSGGLKKEIHISPRPIRMHALDISAGQLVTALQQQNMDAPAGRLVSGNKETLVRVMGRVGANPDGTVLMATGQDAWDLTPIPPGGTENAVALQVSGHSMRGLADDGALIYFEDQRTPPSPDMLGQIVVVEIDTDEVLVKRLLRGGEPGRYDLESLAGPTRHDARLRWAAHITAIIPPFQARRIIVRGG